MSDTDHVIANNIAWVLNRLDEIHKQLEMLMNYLAERGDPDDSQRLVD